MVKCCAYMCQNSAYQKEAGITFHRFPKDNHRKNAWLMNLQRPKFKLKPSSVVCSKHFEPKWLDSSLVRVRLRTNAIPTLFDKVPEYHLFLQNNQSTWSRDLIKQQMNSQTTNDNNPSILEQEMEIKAEITDFEIETTPTTIQYVAKETEIDISPQRNTQDNTSVMPLQKAMKVYPGLEVDKETEVKSEISYFEIEITPTIIQFSADNIEIGNSQIKSPVTSLQSATKNKENPNLEVDEEIKIKSENADFEIETTTQYDANQTEKLSPEELLIELEKRKEKYFERVYECLTCYIGFLSQENYEMHMLCHTMIPDSGPACSTCEVSFATAQGFLMHCRIEHDELKPITRKRISSDEELELTPNAAKGKQIYGCLEAPKQDILCDESNLDTHERAHAGERPYKCNICGKGFNYKSNLNTHHKTHTGETPYKCDKGFKANAKLNNHRKTHNGLKPFKCDICDKGFNLKGNLSRHRKTHAGDKSFNCNIM